MAAVTADLAAQVAEVQRECAMRDRVYGDWVLAGKMTAEESATRIRRMRAALATLEALEAGRDAPGRAGATLADQVAEVKRELGLRRRVYPRITGDDPAKAAEAQRRMDALTAALATLTELADARRAHQPELGL